MVLAVDNEKSVAAKQGSGHRGGFDLATRRMQARIGMAVWTATCVHLSGRITAHGPAVDEWRKYGLHTFVGI